METLKEKAERLEHWVTPQWAVDAILNKEILTRNVIDPCCGTGIMAEAAKREGYSVKAYDVEDWEGYLSYSQITDFLNLERVNVDGDFTVFMNPPFSKTCEFVEKSFELGARKIVMFQRWAFRESAARRRFLENNPMARMYLCCERATCWRYDLHLDMVENGTKRPGTPTAHGWFVWERGQEQSNPPTFSLYKN